MGNKLILKMPLQGLQRDFMPFVRLFFVFTIKNSSVFKRRIIAIKK